MDPVLFLESEDAKFAKLHTKLFAWLIHLFTASAAVLGVWSLLLIHEGDYRHAFLLMTLALIIDSIDGTLARLGKVKSRIPHIDGALLDNIVDYLTYVIVPCFLFYLYPGMLITEHKLLPIAAIILSSAYQFCHTNAKTDDHFFRGFPSYWNFVIFYMIQCKLEPVINTVIVYILALMSFIPVKYIYLSRMHYVTNNIVFKRCIIFATLVFSYASIMLLIEFPNPQKIFLILSFAYVIIYFLISLFRTIKPLTAI